MKAIDAKKAAAMASALFPGQVPDATQNAWARELEAFAQADALSAIRVLAKSQTSIALADLVAECRRVQVERERASAINRGALIPASTGRSIPKAEQWRWAYAAACSVALMQLDYARAHARGESKQSVEDRWTEEEHDRTIRAYVSLPDEELKRQREELERDVRNTGRTPVAFERSR